MIIEKYQQYSNSEVLNGAKKQYEAQFKVDPPLARDEIESFETIFRQYQKEASSILDRVGPILYQCLYEMKTNRNGEYYEWDETTNAWYLPNDPEKVPSSKGAAINFQILSQKYQSALKSYFSAYGLQKRSRPLGQLAKELGNSDSHALNQLLQKIHRPWYRRWFGWNSFKKDAKSIWRSTIMRFYVLGFGAVAGFLLFYGNVIKKDAPTSDSPGTKTASDKGRLDPKTGRTYYYDEELDVTYYIDPKTNISYYLDPESGAFYYYDEKSGESVWQ